MFKWYFRRKRNEPRTPRYIGMDFGRGGSTSHEVFMVNGKVVDPKSPSGRKAKEQFDIGMDEFRKGMAEFSKSMKAMDDLEDLFKDFKRPRKGK